ncbi:hypothetical protein Pmani_001842 [Petrolisthes manimaculis]|uniref:DNA-directed RNA polymerase n=1 Tax=Petrolisthes manimaculis TaxID=1843537 RepID=A0AAE1QJ62_9EUCA|nr:hypothetical protein Pmani_001842 [Petrolisthes manimaculis]
MLLQQGSTTHGRTGIRRWQSTNIQTRPTKPQSRILRVDDVNVQSRQVTIVESKKDLPIQPSLEPTQKKKNVKGKKKKKQIEESEHLQALRRKGREFSFNQSLATYISVCMSLGMTNRATHTLLYYRQLAQHTTRKNFAQIIKTVLPYNIVLRGLAEKGNYSKMVEVMKCLQADNIRVDETTFACLLECLGRQCESPANTTEINTWLTAIEEQGIDLDNVLNKIDLIKDGLEYALKAVHRVQPSFIFTPTTSPLGYDNNLVKKLNQTLHTTKVSSPAYGTVTKEQLVKWSEEQLETEAKGVMVIKSIEALDESDETHKYRKLVEDYEQQWRSVLLDTFTRTLGVLKKNFFSNQLDKRMTVYPYLVSLAPEEFVDIMVQEIQRMGRGSLAHSMTKYMMYRHLGELVYSRYLMHYKKQSGYLNKLQEMYGEYISWYMDNDRPEGVTYVPRVRWQELAENHLSGSNMDHYPIEWPNPVLVSVGKFLYSLMIMKTMVWNPLLSQVKHKQPAIYEVEINKDYRVVDEIKPSPSLLELYQKAVLPTLTFETTKIPMVCPPIPWVSTRLGGYLLNDTKIVRLPYNAQQQQKRMEDCGVRQLYPTMDSLNQLSTIPWRVNQPMLDILIHLFNSKGCEELDIPPPSSECPKPEKIQSGMSKAEVHKAKRQQLEYDQRKNEMLSLWCDMLYKLSIANHYRDRVFWFPHNMDFRGRVYPTPPHLNHLSSDSIRSILQFALGKKLGPKGLWWLKLHLINLTGLVKREPISARLDYCDSIMEDILDSADNPLDGRRWWTKSDEPWQTLAACKELAAALRSGNPEEYVSHLPIHQDGSCNGLQHYAALGRDEIGAKSVNLAPCSTPQDVYSDVAALVEKEREEDANAEHQLAQVLEGHIKRKIIKQTVMTTVYGVTRFGARLQIEKQLKALDDFPQNHRWAASHYLVQKTFICLEKMFTSTKEIQNWFTDCAKTISETRGQNLEYVTPLGLPVVQPYSNFKYRYAVDSASISQLPASYSIDSFMKPNVMKQKNAFPPNFIHSLDSSHMMLTSLHCQSSDITFVSVHDCFWTHACSVDIMNKVCRQQFVALHQEPILEDLSRFLDRKFTLSPNEFDHDGSALDASRMKLNNIISKVPPKGEFDINSVLDSVYFFS